MPEVEITREQIIVVEEVGENSYGDLIFTDKEGKEYKIGNKRRQYFDDIILPGVAVQLNYSKFKGREYIYNAKPVKDILPDKPAPQSKSSPAKEESKPFIVEHKSSPETGMWWKELGDMLRCGDIDITKPEGKASRNAYYTEMIRVLGINIKEVKPADNPLVKEAKKLGAKEIKKEDNN